MKNMLNQFVEHFEKSEDFQRELTNLERAIGTKEWKFFKDMLLMIQGLIATDMLSAKYTNLDKEGKDVLQKTYYNINQLLVFFMNPLGWVKKRSKWRDILKNGRVPNLKRKG